MKNKNRMAIALAVLVIGAGSTGATTVIDTTPANASISALGENPASPVSTYGQTFVAPSVDNVLDSFTVSMSTWSADPVNFAFYLMDWNVDRASGSVLASSPMYSSYDLDAYETFTFTTGGVELTPGEDYVVMLSTADFWDGNNDYTALAARNDDPYVSGKFYHLGNGDDFSLVTTTSWSEHSTTDLAFTATFSSSATVPDGGATLALLGFGILAVEALRKNRKR